MRTTIASVLFAAIAAAQDAPELPSGDCLKFERPAETEAVCYQQWDNYKNYCNKYSDDKCLEVSNAWYAQELTSTTWAKPVRPERACFTMDG